jgi:hypothetical protein
MNTIYFSDKGDSIELTDQELVNLMKRITHMGLKIFRTRYSEPEVIIMLSPCSISRIVLGEDDDIGEGEEDDGQDEISADVRRKIVEQETVLRDDKTAESGEGDAVAVEEVEEKPETAQERNDRLIAEMKLKSDCSNSKDHMGHEQLIYYQDVQMRKKNAKKGLPSRRYFPVCSFCGLRQKYVKADSLTDEQKENAKLWTGAK